MKYVSIDIETTGLNPENCQILTVGAIIEDTNNKVSFDQIPKFHCTIVHPFIQGDPYALNLNKEIIKDISDYISGSTEVRNKMVKEKGLFITENLVAGQFTRFLEENDFVYDGASPIKINVAGKNFATFDKLFLEKLPRWKQYIKINQRILDPSVLFTDWKEDQLPNLAECKSRAGMESIVAHTAVEDAWDVVELFRTKY